MKSIKVTKLFSTWMGFTNQIYVLVSNILHCIDNNIKFLVVGNFLKEINSNNTAPITEILDLDTTNNFLLNNYGITLVYNNQNDFKFIWVGYGVHGNNVDITNEFLSTAIHQDKKITFKKNLNLNSIKGDVCPNVQKRVFIKYSINGREMTDEFEEYESYLSQDIVFDFNDYERTPTSTGWGIGVTDAPTVDHNKFTHILKNISYNQQFKQNAWHYVINHLDMNEKMNVFHIRNEEDAVKHWSKLNKMSQSDFQMCLDNKYINIICTLVNKTDKNIILSWSQDNSVIRFMRENGYDVHFIPKDYSLGREINAINDFCISKFCNNIFIGNYNPHVINNNCSTYSYYVSKNLNPNVKQVLIDIEHIHDNCIIYYNN